MRPEKELELLTSDSLIGKALNIIDMTEGIRLAGRIAIPQMMISEILLRDKPKYEEVMATAATTANHFYGALDEKISLKDFFKRLYIICSLDMECTEEILIKGCENDLKN